MGRMPIFHRNPLTIEPCDSWFYGGLIQISLGYTPVEGRLHTCYAPVRRSSAESKLSLLPLDLHVLGLPLAFILSQDQTLHCNVVVCFLAINSRIIDKVFCIPCFLNQYVKNLFLISLSLDWGGKCKKVFSNTATLICFFF